MFLLRLSDETRIRTLQFLSEYDKITPSGQEISGNGSCVSEQTRVEAGWNKFSLSNESILIRAGNYQLRCRYHERRLKKKVKEKIESMTANMNEILSCWFVTPTEVMAPCEHQLKSHKPA